MMNISFYPNLNGVKLSKNKKNYFDSTKIKFFRQSRDAISVLPYYINLKKGDELLVPASLCKEAMDRLLDTFRTTINVEGDLTGALIVQKISKL